MLLFETFHYIASEDGHSVYAIAGAVGGIVGGVVKSAVGIGQAISGAIKRKKADAMLPSGPTAEERALTERTERQLRQAEVNAPESELNAAQRTQQMLTSAMLKQGATPGRLADIASYMQPIQQDIASRSMDRAANLRAALQQQTEKAGDIKRDVQMLRSARMSAAAEKNIAGGTQNLMATLGMGKKKGLLDNLGGMSGKAPKLNDAQMGGIETGLALAKRAKRGI